MGVLFGGRPFACGGEPRLYTESVLENPRSPRVRAVAKLTKRAARQETGLYLLEGPQASREALTWRPDTLVELYATPSAWEKHQDIRDAASDAGVEVEFASERRVVDLAEQEDPLLHGSSAFLDRHSHTSSNCCHVFSARMCPVCYISTLSLVSCDYMTGGWEYVTLRARKVK